MTESDRPYHLATIIQQWASEHNEDKHLDFSGPIKWINNHTELVVKEQLESKIKELEELREKSMIKVKEADKEKRHSISDHFGSHAVGITEALTILRKP